MEFLTTNQGQRFKSLDYSCAKKIFSHEQFKRLAEQLTWEILRKFNAALFPWTGEAILPDPMASLISNNCFSYSGHKTGCLVFECPVCILRHAFRISPAFIMRIGVRQMSEDEFHLYSKFFLLMYVLHGPVH